MLTDAYELTSGFEKSSIHYYWLFPMLAFVFQPLYVLILLVLLEGFTRVPATFNFLIAFSISLTFINRDVGNGWSSGDFIAQDDALNYLYYYDSLFDPNFFFWSQPYVYFGSEPLWFLISAVVKIISGSSDIALIAISVLIPVYAMHKSFIVLSKYVYFNSFLFYVLYPEINHIIYHLYRFSLSLGFFLLFFAIFLNHRKKAFKYLVLSLLAHSSTLMYNFFFFTGRFFKVGDSLISSFAKLRLFFSTIVTLVIIVLLLFIFFKTIEFEKVKFYLNSEEVVSLFVVNSRHIVYLCMSIYMLWVSKIKISYVVSLVSTILLILPMIYNLTIIYERVLNVCVPILLFVFLYEMKIRRLHRRVLTFFLIGIGFNLWSKSENLLFYKYMSNGHNFDLFNGIGLNLLDIILKITT